MAQAEVFSGICGFTTKIIIDLSYEQNEAMQITSDCKHIDELAKNLGGEDLINIATKEMMGNPVFRCAQTLPHPGCPVPAGIIKCAEVALELALPKDAYIKIEK